MKVFHHSQLPSTSTEALRLLNAATPTPFAVIADEQSSGRGQHARSWQSPRGNLYISLACTLPAAQAPWLPLQSALKVAQWMQQLCSIPVFIKWPNDIFIQRKKVAGILCEAFWKSDTSTVDAIIGIGINIDLAPQIPQAHYESANLRSFLRDPDRSLDSLRTSFLEACESQESLDPENLLTLYEQYHIPTGSLWKDTSDQSLYTHEGFSKEGHLLLKNLETQERKVLVSSSQGFQWVS